ncbi:MAG: hypothetical protein FJX56_02515 [Alphaproteobacteria bacterium]|nr:hypothetical protein [Alphaproteobacteria bacterium]
MRSIYVARSQGLQKWGEGVGVTKHLYKIALAEDDVDEAIARLNEEAHAGESDWRLVKKAPAGDLDETIMFDRIAVKEKAIDPRYYPKIKNATGVFKVKPANVENYFLVKAALEGHAREDVKIRPAEISTYLIACALADRQAASTG